MMHGKQNVKFRSAVLTDVKNTSTRCFIASLLGTGNIVRDDAGVLLLSLYMRAYEWGLCSLNLSMKRKSTYRKASYMVLRALMSVV